MRTPSSSTSQSVRRIVPHEVEFLPSLHEVLDLAAHRGEVHPRVSDLLRAEDAGAVDTRSLFGAFDSTGRVAAALMLTSPGHASLALVRQRVPDARIRAGLEAALRSGLSDVWSRGVTLAQALAPDRDPVMSALLSAVGFSQLTTLIYLTQHPPFRNDERRDEIRPSWMVYGAGTADVFKEVLRGSYIESQDCPELSPIRDVDDVVATHRAKVDFDPGLWFVAMLDGVPAGVLLLNRISSPGGLEIVYLGVVPEWRGRGVSGALMAKAVEVAVAESAMHVTLAVDIRNAPARKMYSRWGYVETLRRRAYTVTPP